METRVILGVYFNQFTGSDGRQVTLMKIAHFDPTPGLDENWDGHMVEVMPVQEAQIQMVMSAIEQVPGLYDLNIRRVAAKTKSGGDAARLQVAQVKFRAPVTITAAELAHAK